ncbi:MAG: RES family NAD+ phosphorylase [Sulfitobacter sp.]
METFKSDLSPSEIRQRLEKFRTEARNNIPEPKLAEMLHSIFLEKQGTFPIRWKQFEKGTLFFRARKLPEDDRQIPLNTIAKRSDAWEPPAESVCSPGRLNKIGQAVLYTCAGDPMLAIDEARARDCSYVALMVYRAKLEIRVAIIGDYLDSGLPQDAGTAAFYSFLEEEFSQFAEPSDQNRYAITRIIAESYFTYPEQSAWCYRSVQSPDLFNTAFLPDEGQKKLELVGVLICNVPNSQEGNLKVVRVVDFDPDSGLAQFHLIGSERQKKLFPEIS